MTAAGAARERNRVEYVTQHFRDLQGLRMLPLAGVLMAWGASEARLLTGTVWWVTFWTSIVVAVVGMPLISRWYARRFGTVEPIRDPKQSAKLAVVAAALVVLAVVMMALGATGRLPRIDVVALPGLVLGVALALIGIAQGPVARREQPWIWRYGAALALVAATPIGLWTASGSHPVNASGVMSFVIAGYIVVASVDAHVALTRMLSSTGGDQGGEA